MCCCVWLATSVIKNYCLPAGKYLGCWVSLFIFCFPFASLSRTIYVCVCWTQDQMVCAANVQNIWEIFSLSFSRPFAGTLNHPSAETAAELCVICSLFCVLRTLCSCLLRLKFLILLCAVLRNVSLMEMWIDTNKRAAAEVSPAFALKNAVARVASLIQYFLQCYLDCDSILLSISKDDNFVEGNWM